MRLTSRAERSRGDDCDVIRRLTSGRNSVRGFPQVNIPPSSSLELHYSRSDRLLPSDPAAGRHGNSPPSNRWWEQKVLKPCMHVSNSSNTSLHLCLLSHTQNR